MPEYYCSICDYTATHKGNYDKHLVTSKHLSNKVNAEASLKVPLQTDYKVDNFIPLDLEPRPKPIKDRKRPVQPYEDVVYKLKSTSNAKEVAKDLVNIFILKHRLNDGFLLPLICKEKIKLKQPSSQFNLIKRSEDDMVIRYPVIKDGKIEFVDDEKALNKIYRFLEGIHIDALTKMTVSDFAEEEKEDAHNTGARAGSHAAGYAMQSNGELRRYLTKVFGERILGRFSD